MKTKEMIRKALHAVEKPFDAAKYRLKRRFDLFDPVHIMPYRGYGNGERAQLMGRVLEDKEIGNAHKADPWWRNSLSMTRRFTTDEIPNVPLRAAFLGQTQKVTTDSEGYFHLNFELAERPPADELWHEVQLELIEEITPHDRRSAVGEILTPPQSAQFGVISDIDDTILKSSVTDAWRMAWLTFSNNAHTRTPFPNVASFYRALQRGRSAGASNPIFYVSSSAWNIYDLLAQFMQLHNIPKGPILLRDLGLDSNKLIKSGHDHKLNKVDDILSYYDGLPFLLIGDSGQRDPWLYREVVRRYPGRIAAIYIRDVRASRRQAVNDIVAEVKSEGVDMLLVNDARQAAEHADAAGLIDGSAI